MSLEAVASLVVEVLFFGTWTGIGVGLVWLVLAVRRTPMEVLQLRVFANPRALLRAIVSGALGTFAGMIALAPVVLGLAAPVAWTVGWTVAWAVGMWTAIATTVGIFRVKGASAP